MKREGIVHFPLKEQWPALFIMREDKTNLPMNDRHLFTFTIHQDRRHASEPRNAKIFE